MPLNEPTKSRNIHPIVWERIRVPVRSALAVTALLVVIGDRNPFLLATVLAVSFVISIIARQLVVSARKLADRRETSLPAALLDVMRNDTGYWGQMSHLGVALLATGIALSSNLAVDATVLCRPDQTASVAGFDLTYVERFERQEPSRMVTGAQISVARNGEPVAKLEPRLNQYPQARDTVATPDVDYSVKGDLYLSLKKLDDQGVSIRVFWCPLIWLVWVGGFVTAIAGLWSRLVRKSESERSGVESVHV